MVVDDSHLAAPFQDLLTFHKAQLVCIHHHAERFLGDNGQSSLGVDKIIRLPGNKIALTGKNMKVRR